MSRTDQHAPFLVRLARGDLHAHARHDHRNGPCDLVRRDQAFTHWSRTTRCYWRFTFTGTSVCSCPLCHAGPQLRAERRAARHHARAALDGAMRRWTAGDRGAFDELFLGRR